MNTSSQEGGIAALLGRGGWEVLDPRPIAAAHPDTFEMPTPGELAALAPASVVRAMFRTATIADVARDRLAPYGDDGRPTIVTITERMWSVVTGADGDVLECVLTNRPFATHTSLLPHDRLRIPRSHVIAADTPLPDYPRFLEFLAQWESDPDGLGHDPARPVPPDAPPRMRRDQRAVCERVGARPEPPAPFGRVLLANDVTPDTPLVHGARFEPNPDRGDCGWIFFGEQLDIGEVARAVGFRVAMLQDAQQRHPRIWPYVALPPGWGFTVATDGDDVYPVQED